MASKDRNILLKYKGGSNVLPRKGDSINRVGIIGKMQGRRASEHKIDYSTNVDDLNLVFTISV
jgi:hypothetical protein